MAKFVVRSLLVTLCTTPSFTCYPASAKAEGEHLCHGTLPLEQLSNEQLEALRSDLDAALAEVKAAEAKGGAKKSAKKTAKKAAKKRAKK